jgi:GT2 family glycosyltransferase
MRAWKKGYKCAIYTVMKVDHELERDNPFRSSLYQYYSLRNRFLYIRKHHPNLKWILELFWTIWGMQRYARAALMGLSKESLAYRMAIADQARGIFGDRNVLFSV